MPGTRSVSVIIPTRNCLKWLPRAIASIGPAPDAEIIVFDDGSTDGTDRWLEDAARADPRIVVLRGTGIGPSRARNRAIEAARAPLLAFLDADDVWYPGKLEAQVALHRQWPEVVMSFTDYRQVTEDGDDRGSCFAYWPSFRRQVGGRSHPFALGGNAMERIFAENVVGTSTVFARTAAVRAEGGFSDDLPSSEDWDLWLRLAMRGQVMCVPSVMADYLMHRPGNVTANMRARVLAVRMIGRRHKDAVARLPVAVRLAFQARIWEGMADIAHADGRRWDDLVLRLGAFALAPSRRLLREAVGAGFRAARSVRQKAAVSKPRID